MVDALDGKYRLRRTIFTVSGTAAPWDWTYPADIARALGDRWFDWQGVSYPATAFPMGPSTRIGIAEHARLLEVREREAHDAGRPFEWVGAYYSQGAMVGSAIYKMCDPGGPLERFRDSCKAVATLGNPCREKGVANGNKFAGWPAPSASSRGIATASERMVDTPPWWFDFAHPGDIYTDTPDNQVGEDMTMIYRVVQDVKNIVIGPDSGLEQVLELLQSPLREMPAAVIAIINGLRFIARPIPTEPHVNYDITPAVRYLDHIGVKVPVAL